MNALETRSAPDQDERTERSPSRKYGSVVLGLVLVVAGGLWLLDVLDVLDLRVAIVLPALLAVVGLALIAGAADGPHDGLVVFGIFLTVAVVAAAATPPNAFSGGIGERTHAVTDQASLESTYNVGVGDLWLDLSDLSLTESAVVDVTVGAGEMRIDLPDDVAVRVEASAGAGEIDLLGQTTDGLSVTRSYETPGFENAGVTLTLDLDVAAGKIEVNE